MRTRLFFGIPAAIVLLGLVLWAPTWLIQLTVLIAAAFAYLEYDRLMFQNRSVFRWILMTSLVLAIIYQIGRSEQNAFHLITLSFVAICSSILFQYQTGDFIEAVRALSLQLLGLFYVCSLFGFLVPIAHWADTGRFYLLYLFLLVFLGDTTAYFAGMKWGQTKLAEKISPNKTVEGAVAAMLSSVVITWVWIAFIYPETVEKSVYRNLILFSPVLSLLAQGGDLFESVLKRSQSQKDSGVFLPGHGGILDRIDGLAFTGPAFYLFIYYFLGRY